MYTGIFHSRIGWMLKVGILIAQMVLLMGDLLAAVEVPAMQYGIVSGVPAGSIQSVGVSVAGTNLALRGVYRAGQAVDREFLASLKPDGRVDWVAGYPENADSWVSQDGLLLVGYTDHGAVPAPVYRFGAYRTGSALSPVFQKVVRTSALTVAMPLVSSGEQLLLQMDMTSTETRAARVSRSGAVVWAKKIPWGTLASGPFTPFQSADGSLLWQGVSLGVGAQGGTTSWPLFKTGTDGRLVWGKRLIAASRQTPIFVPMLDGGWFGYSTDIPTGTTILKLNSDGGIRWAKTIQGVILGTAFETKDSSSVLASASTLAGGRVLLVIRQSDGAVVHAKATTIQGAFLISPGIDSQGVFVYGSRYTGEGTAKQNWFAARADSSLASWSFHEVAFELTDQVQVASLAERAFLSVFRPGGETCQLLPVRADLAGSPCGDFQGLTATMADFVTATSATSIESQSLTVTIVEDSTLQLGDEPLDVRANEVQISVEPRCPSGPATNRPPVAGDDGGIFRPNTVMTIPISAFLQNDSDPDGDPLSLRTLSQGTQGGSVSVVGNSIIYTPKPGFSGYETFTYTIADREGASSTGTVWLAIVSGTIPEKGRISVEWMDGRVVIHAQGTPGVQYTLEASTNLRDWVVAATATALPHGFLDWYTLELMPGGVYFRLRSP